MGKVYPAKVKYLAGWFVVMCLYSLLVAYQPAYHLEKKDIQERGIQQEKEQPFEPVVYYPSIPKPNISRNVAETRVAGMQVLTWNDKHSSKQKVLLYLHGGSYMYQASDIQLSLIDRLATRVGAKVVVPSYPLAPTYTYKDAFSKIETLYKQILSETTDAQNVIFIGDSAGGGFSLGFAMYARDHGLPQPKDLILLSPWVDIKTNNPRIKQYEALDNLLSAPLLQSAGEAWAGSVAAMSNPYLSPIYGNFKDLATISIFVGTHDILFPDNEKLHELLREKGIIHHYTVADKMSHVYMIHPSKEADEALNKMALIILRDPRELSGQFQR